MKYDSQRPVRLIAVDLDGTLLRRDKTVSERTKEAIRACRARGIRFIFATGRSEAAAKEYLDLLRPDAAVLAYGAQVIADGKTVFRRMMSPKVANRVLLGAGAAQKLRYQTEDGACYFTEAGEGMLPLNREEKITRRVEHLCAWALNEQTARALAREAGCALSQTVGDLWCNFSARGVGKGAGVRRVMRLYGLERGSAVAFGDESCDGEMFNACGIGVAMGNGDEVVRACADYETASNDCDGIAVFLEQYVLQNA